MESLEGVRLTSEDDVGHVMSALPAAVVPVQGAEKLLVSRVLEVKGALGRRVLAFVHAAATAQATVVQRQAVTLTLHVELEGVKKTIELCCIALT